MRSSSWFSHGLVLIALSILLAPTSLSALELEPYVFAAQRDGDTSFSTGIACIEIVGHDCPVAASTEDSGDAWGVGLGVRIDGPWWLDLRWSRQDSDTVFLGAPDGRVLGQGHPLRQSDLHAGVLYRFSEKRVSPFATAFIGLSRLSSDHSTLRNESIDLERSSGGLGGGLLVDLGPRVGLRAEIRGIRTDLPDDFDEDLEQVEGSLGLRLRFR